MCGIAGSGICDACAVNWETFSAWADIIANRFPAMFFGPEPVTDANVEVWDF